MHMHVAVMNCRRMMPLLASSSEFECPIDTVACAMKPEHLGGCSQSVQSGVCFVGRLFVSGIVGYPFKLFFL